MARSKHRRPSQKPAAIAARLSRAQREALAYDGAALSIARGTTRSVLALQGLIEWQDLTAKFGGHLPCGVWTLTNKGREVSKHIPDEESPGYVRREE